MQQKIKMKNTHKTEPKLNPSFANKQEPYPDTKYKIYGKHVHF